MAAGLPATDRTPPIALTIAGSDSGGGAGIQADLRTFALHRIHGTSAVTCVTAQNTLGVTRVDALPPEAVIAQIAAVVDDMGIQALKTGMLFEQAIIEVVASAIEQRHLRNVVVDPVMVSRAGAKLLADDAITAMRSRMVPLADVLTPNRYEAQILANMEITTLDDMKTAVTRIHKLGPKAVLIKGGGMYGEAKGTDVWFDGDRTEVISTIPIDTHNTHGTGCTLSAAIAAHLAQDFPPIDAVQRSKRFVTRAIANALAIGQGQGPIGHFYA
ncbi:MAG: bifunctional hydroxymethylpyrimidine kinase/phosphomethylpyrimidine kinase [Cyanobacteria bacterium P01_E01_bin.34]